jgi:D-alanyl-D-alanine carboxypeptidase
MRHLLFTALILLAASGVVRADPIDDYVRAQIKAQNIPGLSIAVVKDGQIVKAAGYGLADRKLKLAATPETVFHVGSIGKQFVATGIMLLVQEGRLSVDDPISKHLKGIPVAWNGISIRHLLTHTSGMIREEPGLQPFRDRIQSEVVKTAYSLPLLFAPGEKWAYSNTGYALLGEIISAASGRPWSEYITEKVFVPSGMRSTFPVNTKEAIASRARGYSDNDKLIEAEHWRSLYAAGGFLSTVLDLAKWDAALYTDRILSDSTRRQMWTPVQLNDGTSHPYGFGWEINSSMMGHNLVRHGGQVRGILSEFARFVDYGLTIIVLMNMDDLDWQTIVRGVSKFYIPAEQKVR